MIHDIYIYISCIIYIVCYDIMYDIILYDIMIYIIVYNVILYNPLGGTTRLTLLV